MFVNNVIKSTTYLLIIFLFCKYCELAFGHFLDDTWEPPKRDQNNPGCFIDLRSSDMPFVVLESDKSNILLPQTYNRVPYLFVPNNTNVFFVCPGSEVEVGKYHMNRMKTKATCISGDSPNDFKWSDLSCRQPIKYIFKEYQRCDVGYRGANVTISIVLYPLVFDRIYSVCFDANTLIPFYSTHKIKPAFTIPDRDVGGSVPGVKSSLFGGVDERDMISMYKKKNQRKVINKLVGIPINSTIYIDDYTENHLSWNYLTPPTDFFYKAIQNSTFNFFNAAPQWLSITLDSWRTIEQRVRKYAMDYKRYLSIRTGTFGTALLWNPDSGENYKLYLGTEQNPESLRVPAFFWKVVVDQEAGKSIAFVCKNNPFPRPTSDVIPPICPNITEESRWFENYQLEHVYVCSVSELAKVVPFIPVIAETDLLIYPEKNASMAKN